MPKKRRKKEIRSYLLKKGAVVGSAFGQKEGFDEYVSLAQAGLKTGFAPETLAALIDENRLRAVDLDQERLIKICWIEEFAKKSNDCRDQSEQLKKRIEAYSRASQAFQGCMRAWAKRSDRPVPISQRMTTLVSEPAALSYVFFFSLLLSGFFLGNGGQKLVSEYDRGMAKIGRAEFSDKLTLPASSLDATQLAASVSVAEAAGFMANSMWQGAIFSNNNALTRASDMFYSATKELRDFFRYLIYGRTEVYVIVESPEVEGVVFEKSFDALEEEISDYTASRFSDFREEFGLTDEQQNPTVKRGTVIVPKSGKNQKLLTDLEKSFSDDVEIEPTDDNSGVIVPVFREKKGDEYIYIFVPVKKDE
jgi:hypothetical protein